MATMNEDIPLSDSEWELMKALWESAPCSAAQLAERVQTRKAWHPKTVRTMLNRLHKKGMLHIELIDGVQHYSPVYSRHQCEQQATQSFLQRVFDGALTPMLAQFTRQKPLSPEERQALLALLDEPKPPAVSGQDQEP